MLESLSIKQKFIAVVAIVLVGFGIQASITFSTLNQLDDTAQQVVNTQISAQILNELQLSLYTITLQRSTLAPDNIRQLSQVIKSGDSDQQQALNRISHLIQSSSLDQQLVKISPLLTQYFRQLNQWLTIKTELGIESESGLLAMLDTKASFVEQQVSDFAQMEQQFVKVKSAQQTQLLSLVEQKAESFERTLSALIELINELEFNEMLPAVDDYLQSFLLVQSKYKELQQIEHKLLTIVPEVEQLTKQAADHINNVLLPKVITSNDEVSRQSRMTLLIAGLSTAVIIMFLLLFTGKSISKGLTEVVKLLQQLSNGDFSQAVSFNSSRTDEFAELMLSVNLMANNLKQLVEQSDMASAVLADISIDLSDSTQLMAQTNDEISVQTTQLASSSEQMSVSANQVAQTTNQLHQTAIQTTKESNSGANLMQQTDQANHQVATVVNEAASIVQQLGNSVSDIGSIVDVIDEIAAQTNLLALNAAIEAARAGDAGRGFAVVADEVRDLAAKTVLATTKITTTVNDIQHQSSNAIEVMQEGQEKVLVCVSYGENALKVMNQLNEYTDLMSEHSAQIATAVEQMSITLRDNSQSIEKAAFEVSGHQNTVNHVAENAQTVASKAVALKELTSNFNF